MSRRTVEITADLMLRAYRHGLFPMAETRRGDRLYWLDPERRGILPLDRFHLPRRLARTVLSDAFAVTVDQDFAGTIAGCAHPAPGREDTWINPQIERLFGELHQLGHAHSVETRQDGHLVGGLYGVAIGGVFFGESMFSIARDASKVALVHLVARLRLGGFRLLDTQFVTAHLSQFGADGTGARRLQGAARPRADRAGPASLSIRTRRCWRPRSAPWRIADAGMPERRRSDARRHPALCLSWAPPGFADQPLLRPSRDVDVTYRAAAPQAGREIEQRVRWLAASQTMRIDPPTAGLHVIIDYVARRMSVVRDATRSVVEMAAPDSLDGMIGGEAASGIRARRRGNRGGPDLHRMADAGSASAHPAVVCITDDGVLLRAGTHRRRCG